MTRVLISHQSKQFNGPTITYARFYTRRKVFKCNFFFFSRHYNPWWVLACFTISFLNLLSLNFSLQFLIFIFFKSSSTWSSHLSLGLPTGLDEHGSHSVNFLTVLVVTWCFSDRASWIDYILITNFDALIIIYS